MDRYFLKEAATFEILVILCVLSSTYFYGRVGDLMYVNPCTRGAAQITLPSPSPSLATHTAAADAVHHSLDVSSARTEGGESGCSIHQPDH